MIISADLHLHSDHSVDGHATIDAMCQAARDKDFTTICFTEHFDMNPADWGHGYLDFDKYSDDIKQARDKYGEHLTVLKGIEFSEPHLYRREFEAVVGRDFDFVLVSIHYLEGFGAVWVNQEFLQPEYPVQKFYESYYRMVLKTVEFGGFDALAHIDLPKRYLPRRYEPGGLLDSILKEMVKKNIALEINTKGFEYPINELHPSDTICGQYMKLGGTKITAGSDAHRCDKIGQDFDRVAKVVQTYKFKPVYFVQRKEFQS